MVDLTFTNITTEYHGRDGARGDQLVVQGRIQKMNLEGANSGGYLDVTSVILGGP